MANSADSPAESAELLITTTLRWFREKGYGETGAALERAQSEMWMGRAVRETVAPSLDRWRRIPADRWRRIPDQTTPRTSEPQTGAPTPSPSVT